MGTLKKSFILLILGIVCKAWALTVTEISLKNMVGTATILIHMDEPYPLKFDQEDPETVVVEFPQGTKWIPKQSEETTREIKSYSYIPYEDGSGDLIIKIDPSLKIDKAGTAPDGIFGISFNPNSGPLQNSAPPLIDNFKIGQKEGKTRLVLSMSSVIDFTAEANAHGSKIMLIPSGGVRWNIQKMMEESNGLFKGYRVIQKEGRSALEISTEPGTNISKTLVRRGADENPKFIMDLDINPALTLLNKEEINQSQILGGSIGGVQGPQVLLNSPTVTKMVNPVFPNEGLIKRMNIILQGNDTILRLITSEKIDFDVTANSYTNQVIIHLPKVKWTDVKVTEESGGLVQGVRVDQSSSSFTNLILTVQKGTHVIGKKAFGGPLENRFILYLNQDENKTPDWLIEDSVADLPYEERDEEEIETSQVVYKGGITPYTNIGEGLYFGAQLDQLSTETEVTNPGGGAPTNTGNLGGGVHVFAGYGLSYNRLYGGLELTAGYYYANSQEKYNNLGTQSGHSTSKINFSWGASTRLGVYVSPTSLFYARIGATSTNFSYRGVNSGPTSTVFSGTFTKRNRTGFLYGLGLEAAMNDKMTLRLEGNQTNYQPFRYESEAGSRKQRPIFNQASVGVSYSLNPMSGPSALNTLLEESVATGFYVGGDAGMGNLTAKTDVKLPPGNISGQLTDSDPEWGLFGGYSINHGRFFMATEAQLNLNPMVIKQPTGLGSITYVNKLSWLAGLTVRPGYIFNHGTIGYGRFGVVSGRFKGSISTIIPTPASARLNKQVWGLRLGGGLETFFTTNLSLRADYTLDYIPNIGSKNSAGGMQDKITLINNQFKLGLSYTL